MVAVVKLWNATGQNRLSKEHTQNEIYKIIEIYSVSETIFG